MLNGSDIWGDRKPSIFLSFNVFSMILFLIFHHWEKRIHHLNVTHRSWRTVHWYPKEQQWLYFLVGCHSQIWIVLALLIFAHVFIEDVCGDHFSHFLSQILKGERCTEDDNSGDCDVKASGENWKVVSIQVRRIRVCQDRWEDDCVVQSEKAICDYWPPPRK